MHRPLRICRTPGCSFQILGRRHRHCCSFCNTADRSLHGERCRQVQLLLAGAAPDTFAPGRCQTEQCGREANWGYRSCCSVCSRTNGRRHSARCRVSAAASSGPEDGSANTGHVTMAGAGVGSFGSHPLQLGHYRPRRDSSLPGSTTVQRNGHVTCCGRSGIGRRRH